MKYREQLLPLLWIESGFAGETSSRNPSRSNSSHAFQSHLIRLSRPRTRLHISRERYRHTENNEGKVNHLRVCPPQGAHRSPAEGQNEAR